MDTKKLRQKILDLAIRGNLFLKIRVMNLHPYYLNALKQRKERLIKEGKISSSKKQLKLLIRPL